MLRHHDVMLKVHVFSLNEHTLSQLSVTDLCLYSPSLGVCAAFVSRTGKTTDVTQIKGWREKFTAPEAPPTSAPPKPEGTCMTFSPNISALIVLTECLVNISQKTRFFVVKKGLHCEDLLFF